MKDIQLEIPLVNGKTWNVMGYPVGSFAVHAGDSGDSDVWTITHIPSMRNVVNGMCFSKSRALKIARMLKRIFSDADMAFVEECAVKLSSGEILSKSDNLKYQALYGMIWADRSISRYAR